MCGSGDFVFGLVACELCFMFINCALTPFLDSTLWLVAKVCTYSHSGHSYACFDSHMCMMHPLISLQIAMIASLY